MWRNKKAISGSGFIDLHTHVLAGIDDGPVDHAVSKQMVLTAYKTGTRSLFVTPHCRPDRFSYTKEQVEQQLQILTEYVREVCPGLDLYVGGELYYDSRAAEYLAHSHPSELQLPVMNGTKTVLVEFIPFQSFLSIHKGLIEIQSKGYDIILAHPERYLCLLDQDDKVKVIHDMGVKLQVNATSITGQNGKIIRKKIFQWMKWKLIDFVSSDAHDLRYRTTDLSKAAALVAARYGTGYMTELFTANARYLIKDNMRGDDTDDK